MALSPSFAITNVIKTDEGSRTELTDQTVYGGANPARSAVAVAIYATKVSETDDEDEPLEEEALSVESYDDETDSVFYTTNTVDGYQKYYCLILNDYAGGTTYNQYDVVHYPTTGLYYRSKLSTPFSGVVPTNTTNWETVTAEDIAESIDESNEPGNLVYDIVETVLSFASNQCLDDAVIDIAREGCCDDCDEKKEARLKKLRVLVYMMQVADSRQFYLEGERQARAAEKLCEDCCD